MVSIGCIANRDGFLIAHPLVDRSDYIYNNRPPIHDGGLSRLPLCFLICLQLTLSVVVIAVTIGWVLRGSIDRYRLLEAFETTKKLKQSVCESKLIVMTGAGDDRKYLPPCFCKKPTMVSFSIGNHDFNICYYCKPQVCSMLGYDANEKNSSPLFLIAFPFNILSIIYRRSVHREIWSGHPTSQWYSDIS